MEDVIIAELRQGTQSMWWPKDPPDDTPKDSNLQRPNRLATVKIRQCTSIKNQPNQPNHQTNQTNQTKQTHQSNHTNQIT